MCPAPSTMPIPILHRTLVPAIAAFLPGLVAQHTPSATPVPSPDLSPPRPFPFRLNAPIGPCSLLITSWQPTIAAFLFGPVADDAYNNNDDDAASSSSFNDAIDDSVCKPTPLQCNLLTTEESAWFSQSGEGGATNSADTSLRKQENQKTDRARTPRPVTCLRGAQATPYPPGTCSPGMGFLVPTPHYLNAHRV